MKNKLFTLNRIFILAVLIISQSMGCFAQKKQSSQIKVGAAKLNITPTKE